MIPDSLELFPGFRIGTVLLCVLAYLFLINFIAFCLYGADKRRAKKGMWRIPERRLIGAAVLGGSLGALAGMRVFHHKTLHRKFTVGVPLILTAQILLAAAYFILTNESLRRLIF